MQGAYGGVICILMYGVNSGGPDVNEFYLLTQDNIIITTQLSQELLATEEV